MIENKANSFEIDDDSLCLLSSGLNGEQLRAAKETKNVVVSAGAGSGKTTVLASRFAYLIEAKNLSAEKILTLTFTKKAANEMKERIFYGLKNHIAGRDIKGKKELGENFPHLKEIKARSREAIEHFDKTHIQTLDSYFSEIAKKGARFYGITPNFTLDDDKIKSEINFMATKYVLENLDKDELKEIAQIFKIQNVAEELFAASVLKYSTVLNPIDFTQSLEIQKSKIIEDYKNLTAQLQDEIEDLFGKDCVKNKPKKPGKALEKLYEYINDVGNPAPPAISGKIFESKENSDSFLNDEFFEYCHGISYYADSYLSQYLKDKDFKSFKKSFQPLLEKLYLLANTISGFDLQKKIFAHLSLFQESVNKTKRTAGLLSFDDVSDLMLKILSEHADIRHIEQAKFEAIMIDEFQDDNQKQCDVLLILSDKNEKYDENNNYLVPHLSDSDLLDRLDTHKLFFVGDDKQSIYRFRGADVSVFRNLSSSIKNALELKTNYRSSAELISGFNTIFGGYDYPKGENVNKDKQAVFMTKEKFGHENIGISSGQGGGKKSIPNYEADYKRVTIPDFRLSEKSYAQKEITIALYPKDWEEKEESSASAQNDEETAEDDRKNYEKEAAFVAREIKKLLNEKTLDKDGNPVQKYHYSDIALLFRTSTPASAYENVLLQAGIPYSTEVYKGFFSDGPINDILSLLKLCVYPEDKNAYAKLLRSPFCSLTFAETEKVLVNTENPYKSPFSNEMLEKIQGDKNLYEKIQNLKNIYEDIKSRLSQGKLTKTISYIWYELGYCFETRWNKTVKMYSSFYDILFEMARLSEQKTQSLASFIDMVKQYEESDKKLDGLDVVLDEEDSVQILTVHKSKGLEYKVVFVCAASAKPKEFGNNVYSSKDFGFLLKTPAWENYDKAAAALGKTGTIRKDNANKSYFFSCSDEENEKQECAELRRIAYVAFTRAEEKLYIVGNSNGEFDDECEAEKKCRKFELHTEDKKEFHWTQSYKKDSKTKEIKELDEPKDLLEPYAYPKSIYQLLLPILYAETENPAFNFINEKEAFDEAAIENGENLKKSDYIKNLKEEKVGLIEEELSPKVYVSPSKIKSEGESLPPGLRAKSLFDTPPSPKGYGSGIAFTPYPLKSPDYSLVNKIVASTIPNGSKEIPDLEDEGEESLKVKTIAPDFGFNDFGTIAHLFMEAAVLNREPSLSGREFIGINEKFISGIGMEKWEGKTNREKKILKIREICSDMAEELKKSQIFREAFSSEWKKTEYSFRSFIENALPPDNETTYAKNLIVTGQIDLVYKNMAPSQFKYTIVDYKTNQKIEPEIYFGQLSCYRRAVSQMLGVAESEIRCVLYYLRFASEVDITRFLSEEK